MSPHESKNGPPWPFPNSKQDTHVYLPAELGAGLLRGSCGCRVLLPGGLSQKLIPLGTEPPVWLLTAVLQACGTFAVLRCSVLTSELLCQCAEEESICISCYGESCFQSVLWFFSAPFSHFQNLWGSGTGETSVKRFHLLELASAKLSRKLPEHSC